MAAIFRRRPYRKRRYTPSVTSFGSWTFTYGPEATAFQDDSFQADSFQFINSNARTASLTATEASDTTTTLVDIEVFGNSNITEDSDTLTSATLDALGTASITEAADTVTADGDAGLNPRLDLTEASDTLTGAAQTLQPVDANLTATEESDYIQTNWIMDGKSINEDAFDDGRWVLTEVTITENATTAPDGTVTAGLITESTTASETHYVSYASGVPDETTDAPDYVAGQIFWYSVYLKANGRSKLHIRFANRTLEWYLQVAVDLAVPSASQISLTGADASKLSISNITIESAANGFYRVYWKATFNNNVKWDLTSQFTLRDNSGNNTYTGDGTSGMYLWGHMWTPYFLPSLDTYVGSNGTTSREFSPSAITEESDRLFENLITRAAREDLSNAVWTKTGGTVTTDSTTAPDASSTADLFTEDSSTGCHAITYDLGSVTANQVKTISVYFKRSDTSLVDLQWHIIDDSNPNQSFVTSNYAVIYFDYNGSYLSRSRGGTLSFTGCPRPTMTAEANGFYRITFSFKSTITQNLWSHFQFLDDSYNNEYTGNGLRSGYFWGAQLVNDSQLPYQVDPWVDVGLNPQLTVTEASDTVTADADVGLNPVLNVTEAGDTTSATQTLALTTHRQGQYNGGKPWTTTSFTPASNSLLVAMLETLDDGTNSVTASISDSAGLTWTLRASAVHSKNYGVRTYIWTAPVTTGTSMTVTFNLSSGDMVSFTVVDITNYDTSSPIGVTGSATGDTNSGSFSLTLSGTSATSSIVLCAASVNDGTLALNGTSGYTILQDTDISFFDASEGYYTGAISSFAISDFSTPYSYGVAAIEVKAATINTFADIGMNGNLTITEGDDSTTTLVDVDTKAASTITEDSDTLTGATLDALATANITEADDTLTGAATVGTNTINATLTVTEDSDTTTTLVDVEVFGNATITEASDTTTADADALVQGNATITEASDTTTTDADAEVKGSLTYTENDDSTTTLVDVDTKASLTVTEADDTLSAGSSDGLASLTVTEDSDTTTTLVDIEVFGNSTITEDSDTTTADADALVQGSATFTEDSDTTSAAAAVEIKAAATINEDSDTTTADADALVQGTFDVTEASDTITADADVGLNPILNATEDSDTSTSTADVELFGNASITEASDTTTTLVDVEVFVNASITEADDTVDAAGSGQAGNTASLIANEESDTLSGATDVDLSGNATITEASDTLTSDVDAEVKAVMNLTYSEENDTSTSAVQLGVNGNSTITTSSDTLNGAGSSGLNPVANITEADDTTTTLVDVTVFGNGTPTSGPDTTTTLVDVDTKAALTVTEASDTLDAAASSSTAINANANITEANDTTTTAVDVDLVGSANINEASDTVTALMDMDIRGSADINEASDTTTTLVDVETKATLALEAYSDTVSALTNIQIVGSLTATEAADSVNGAISALVNGSLNANEANDTVSSESDDALAILDIGEENDTSTGFTFTTGVSCFFNVTEADDTISSIVAQRTKRIRISKVKAPPRLLRSS